MGKDIIYREDAIEALKGREDILHDAYTAVAIIRSIPSADRPQGEWIDQGWHGDWQFETDGRGNCWYEYKCSECGYIKRGGKSNYCPKCGAYMQGGKDD